MSKGLSPRSALKVLAILLIVSMMLAISGCSTGSSNVNSPAPSSSSQASGGTGSSSQVPDYIKEKDAAAEFVTTTEVTWTSFNPQAFLAEARVMSVFVDSEQLDDGSTKYTISGSKDYLIATEGSPTVTFVQEMDTHQSSTAPGFLSSVFYGLGYSYAEREDWSRALALLRSIGTHLMDKEASTFNTITPNEAPNLGGLDIVSVADPAAKELRTTITRL